MTTNNGSMLALIDLNEITQWLHHCSYWCLVARSLCTFELLDVSPHLASQMSIHGGGLSGKDEWLNTFPKQERQHLSLQLSHRYKSLITLAPKVLVWLPLETAETNSAGMLWGFFSPVRGMCSRSPIPTTWYGLVQLWRELERKKGWSKSVTGTASGCVLNAWLLLVERVHLHVWWP